METKEWKLNETFGEEKAKWKINSKISDLEKFTNSLEATNIIARFMVKPHEEIRNILIEILPEKYYDIIAEGGCSKKFSNDKPESVKFDHYDCIEIGITGIYYKPEHGEGKILLDGFTIHGILKYFKNK